METMQEKVERQKAIELDAVALGTARYRAEKPLAWQLDAGQAGANKRREESDLTPGKLMLQEHVEVVAKVVEEFVDAVVEGKAVHKSAAAQWLLHIDPLQAAYIALRHAINAGSGVPFTTLATAIGGAVQEHLEMVKMAEQHPGLERKLSRQLARSTSAKHRLGVLRHVREKYDLTKMGWDSRDRLLIGSKLLEILLNSTPLFIKEKRARGRKDTPVYFAFSPETVEWLEKAHGRCELLSPIHLPMIVPPRPWRTPFSGGYLTDALRPRLIRTRNRDYLNELGGVDLTPALSAVNAIQETPWRINRRVLDVLLQEMEFGGGQAGLPRRNDLPLPPLPPSIPPNVPSKSLTVSQREDLTVWKAKAAKVHQANGEAVRERVLLAQKLYIARRFVDEEAIYFPHSLDFRGRVYPMASYLTPQSDDIGRGLLEFAEGKPLGEEGGYWLAAHIAGIWGVDKCTFQERIDWVYEHEDEIIESALNPFECRFWTEADGGTKPWQALAACIEWLGFAMSGEHHVSHLPVAMDGTCSGLQHYSALLLDEVGGAAVNLVPGERPADVYVAVSNRAQALSDGCLGGTNDGMAKAWEGKFCRKIAKQPTMTLCYSATKYGMKEQIESALHKLDEAGPYLAPDVDRHHAALFAAERVLDALEDTVVAARRAMDWLQEVAVVMTEAGLPIRWTSPIGLPVLQDYRKSAGSVVNVFMGGQRMRLMLKEPTDQRSSRQQTSGIAPNFVHSLDASHLLSTVNGCVANGLYHFAVIHDSFAVHAADTSKLNLILRWAFVEQYREPILAQFREEIISQLAAVKPELVVKIPELPAMGNLDLEGVMESDFFFA